MPSFYGGKRRGGGGKGLSRTTWATKAHPVGDYPSFRSMKQLRLLLLPSVPPPTLPVRVANPSLGYLKWYSPLSYGGHIVPGDQKSFVLLR